MTAISHQSTFWFNRAIFTPANGELSHPSPPNISVEIDNWDQNRLNFWLFLLRSIRIAGILMADPLRNSARRSHYKKNDQTRRNGEKEEKNPNIHDPHSESRPSGTSTTNGLNPNIYLHFGKSQRASEAHRHCRSISSSCRAIANYWGGYALDSSLECGLRSERCKLACLHVGLGQKELAAMAVMAACNCAAANMRKAQPRQRYGLFALLGGKAMSSQKVSPNSAEIVAQLEAGRKGVKAKFCLRFRIASAVLTLLISAAIKLLG